ncbi:hypothetical protein [Gracilinema caldarium]|uniref:hypothetical protein n=1 Tax=Gracilinema caldarium TaxID=215591 RepID=UPI0026ECC52E|nr:hypothetical protein [Gracilinema caldarium]
MSKYPHLLISFSFISIVGIVSIFLFPQLSWISWVFFFLWGIVVIVHIRKSSCAEKTVYTLLEELSSLVHTFGKNDIANQSDISTISSDIKTILSNLLDNNSDLRSKIKKMESDLNNLLILKKELESLCPVHIPIDIEARWNNLIEREWGIVNKDALANLNEIKLMYDQNQEFITEVFREFGEHQEAFIDFSRKYKDKIVQYTEQAGIAKKNILEALSYSSSKIEETFKQFTQVEDIAEKIKMISLNLSIEASKVRGAESFSLLARELRKLAQSTEENTKLISNAIKATVNSMRSSREDEINNLSSIDTILNEFEGLLTEYDTASGKLQSYMRKAIERIQKNQLEQQTILLKFFKTLQQIAIVKEELEHQVQFYGIFLKLTNEYVQKAIRTNKSCLGVECPQRRFMLDELVKITNTDEERKLVNELFKELLNEDREAEHGTLVSDANDFINFN